MRVAFVVNPMAGRAKRTKWKRYLDDLPTRYFEDFRVFVTEARNHASLLTEEAVKNGFDCIVSVGGDGTHNEVLNGIFRVPKHLRKSVKMCFLSAGSGNDFAKTAGIRYKSFAEGIERLTRSNVKNIDVGRIIYRSHHGFMMQRYFINIASLGASGEIDSLLDRLRTKSGVVISFIYATLKTAATFRGKTVSIKVGNRRLDNISVLLIAVANGRFFGGGMMVAPEAKLDDGLFDVVLVEDMGKFERFLRLPSLYPGTHLDHPHVTFIRAKKVEVYTDENLLLDVDGEQPGTAPASFEVLPGAISIIT